MQTISHKLESVLGVKKMPSPEEKELFDKTQDFVRLISWIPGLRMVAVSNSLAMYATHADSDIDLFIITSVNRLWIVRTLVLLMATFLGVRAKPGDEAGKFCFPFFMTDKNLNLREIAIENDVYLAYWIHTLKPIYNQHYVYGRFMQINRSFYESTLHFPLSDEKRAFIPRDNRDFLVPIRKHAWMTKLGQLLSPLLALFDSLLGSISERIIAKKIPTG